jgi:hypothetical protein
MMAITRSHVARYVQDLEDTWGFRLRMATEQEREESLALNAQRRMWAKTTLLAAVLGMTDLRQLLHDPDGVVIAATDDGSLIWDTLVDVDPEPRFYVGPRPGFLRYHTALADVATLVPIDEVRRHLRERITKRIAAITSEERALTAAPGDPDWELYESSQQGTRRWQRQRLLEHRWPYFNFARRRLRQLREELEDERGC